MTLADVRIVYAWRDDGRWSCWKQPMARLKDLERFKPAAFEPLSCPITLQNPG